MVEGSEIGARCDSILAVMNLEIVQVKTELSEETRMSSCNLMKVDGSDSSTMAILTRRWTRAHDMMAVGNTRSSSDRYISKHVIIFDTYSRYTAICSLVTALNRLACCYPGCRPQDLNSINTSFLSTGFLSV